MEPVVVGETLALAAYSFLEMLVLVSWEVAQGQDQLLVISQSVFCQAVKVCYLMKNYGCAHQFEHLVPGIPTLLELVFVQLLLIEVCFGVQCQVIAALVACS